MFRFRGGSRFVQTRPYGGVFLVCVALQISSDSRLRAKIMEWDFQEEEEDLFGKT
jgi:hypothetical protein